MNRPVHFEIHASDPEATAKFYGTVFGWDVRHIPEFNYWMFNTGAGDGINGGMVKRMGEKPGADCPVSAFVCSLGVASVDDALAKAVDLGAIVARSQRANRRSQLGAKALKPPLDGYLLRTTAHCTRRGAPCL